MHDTTGPAYALGASEAERSRLDVQAAYYERATVDALRSAGITEGMHVLDVGCGTGAVTCLAAELVGRTGSVLGIDASAQTLAAARESADRQDLTQVRFEQADVTQWTTEQRFDALTGRLVAMYLPEPVKAIRRLATMIKPGGIVLLQEFSMSASRQVPDTPLFRQTLDRTLATFRALGLPTDFGCDIDTILTQAGLETPTATIGGRWERGQHAVGYALLVGIVRTLAPAMIAHRLVTQDELDIDTLEQRLRADGVGAGVCPPLLFSAWARVPLAEVRI